MAITEEKRKETFGFKSRHHPPQPTELEMFEKDLLNIISSIKFRNQKNTFQQKLKVDIDEIKKSPDVFVFADKTSNIYKMTPQEHNKLLKENVTKTYKKGPPKLETSINLEVKCIATNLDLSNRIEILAQTPAYITLKDHKENFRSNPSCRLINPSKTELGRISKIIFDRINNELLSKLNYNQWKNTDNVINWFKNIDDKKHCKFIQLDIKEFYPSITEETLNKALDFAAKYTKLSKEDIRLIYHCRKSLLFFNNKAWKKKDTDSSFDVTMGRCDGTELCELIGIYTQSLLTESVELIAKENIGLYQDDGLILLRNINSQQTDRLRKRIIKVFQSIGSKIEIVTNLQEVDFLDVTFNLINNTYRPYKKPNYNLTYINTPSNHPPNIIKQLTKTVSERLSRNSSSIEIFNTSKLDYEDALKKSGYTEPLIYIPPKPTGRNPNGRKRKIIWFNPPFNANVSTNIVKIFLRLVDKHFPRSHKLYKIFNRNKVKVSYSCTENMANIIKGHNNNITNAKVKQQLACNCRVKRNCPLNGDCRKESVVYKCTALHHSSTKKSLFRTDRGRIQNTLLQSL